MQWSMGVRTKENKRDHKKKNTTFSEKRIQAYIEVYHKRKATKGKVYFRTQGEDYMGISIISQDEEVHLIWLHLRDVVYIRVKSCTFTLDNLCLCPLIVWALG